MITAKALRAENGLVARLSAKARRLAEARIETRLRAAARDPRRWRKAHLLWPLFTGDT